MSRFFFDKEVIILSISYGSNMMTMDFTLILLLFTFIINCYGDTTVIQSTTPETTLTISETTLTTHEATLTTNEATLEVTLEVTLNTTKEQITENSTVSSSTIKSKDERPDYIWIAYVVVCALLLPLVGVFIVNCMRVRRDEKQENDTPEKA